MITALPSPMNQNDLNRMTDALSTSATQETAAGLIGRLRAGSLAPRFRVVRAPTIPPMPEDALDESSDPGATVIPLAARRHYSF